jgi:hypothetical protein
MPRQCLFCTRTVDSAEHIWSDWILKDLKLSEPIRINIAKRPGVWKEGPEIRVKCVCQRCNNGWMSDLENENKPHVGAMIHDEPTTLEPWQQKLLARWAVLKAIVIESANRLRTPFYTASERTGLTPPSPFLPIETRVWIGRLSAKAFHAGGTDAWGEIEKIPKALHASITTIVVGHLVIQVQTVRTLAMFSGTDVRLLQCKPGAWDVSLSDIWPIFGTRHWPPPVSFSKSVNNIGELIFRWHTGTEIS